MSTSRYIREVMRAQVIRVGEAWKYLEEEVLANAKGVNGEPFKERAPGGMRKEWRDWMQDLHKKRLDALNQALDDKKNIFDPSTITKLKRWDYGGVFSRAGVVTPNCGLETDQKRLKERVGLLVDFKNALTPVNSELKLD
jgi:hypothetical protein